MRFGGGVKKEDRMSFFHEIQRSFHWGEVVFYVSETRQSAGSSSQQHWIIKGQKLGFLVLCLSLARYSEGVHLLHHLFDNSGNY